MMPISVYLSGPVTNRNYKQASTWRKHAATRLRDAGFRVLDPLRGHSFSSRRKKIRNLAEENPVVSDRALKARDKLDCLASDIVLCNFMEADRVSVGSIFEIAWAEDHNKLVVMAIPKNDRFHDHPFTRESAVIFHDFEEALQYVEGCVVEEDGKGEE